MNVTGGASARVVGYQFAIGHRREAAVLLDVQVSDAVADHGAELVLTRIDNDSEHPYGAILVALDFVAPFGDVLPLDLSEDLELARFVYHVEPTVEPGEATTLELRHRSFGDPRVPVIFVDEALNSIEPELRDGEIQVLPVFLRGDCNRDGLIDVSDSISLLLYLFGGRAAPPCADGCDANDDGQLNLSDALIALDYLFDGGAQPSAPFPDVGVDSSFDQLTCLGVADSSELGEPNE